MPYEMGTIKKGDILAYSWGYDQTNTYFYQVTRATAKTAWIRRIGGRCDNGWDEVLPKRDCFLERAEECKRIMTGPKGEQYLSMSFGNANLWDARPCYQTPPGHGH